MAPTVLTARVGADGNLKLDIPLGAGEANKTVRVVVETLPPAKTQEEWQRFLTGIGGSIPDPTFRHHPVGPPEERDWHK